MYACVLHVFNVYLSLFSYYMYVCACMHGPGGGHQEYAWARRWATWRRVCTGIFMMGGQCDWRGEPGSGSPLYYINTWAMVWPTDYPAVALWKLKQNFKTNGPLSFALQHFMLNVSQLHTYNHRWTLAVTWYIQIHVNTCTYNMHVISCLWIHKIQTYIHYTCIYMQIHAHTYT